MKLSITPPRRRRLITALYATMFTINLWISFERWLWAGLPWAILFGLCLLAMIFGPEDLGETKEP